MLPINPPGRELGRDNAVLSGCGSRYFVRDFEGCLSLKSVLQGAADWETDERRFVVNRNCYLILNDRQHYTITIDSTERAETICLFFQRGFVEDIHRAMVTPDECLLDSPEDSRFTPLEFFNRLEPQDSVVLGLLRDFHAEFRSGRVSRIEWDQNFLRVGQQLALERAGTLCAMAKVPAARASTRVELYRRLLRGRDFLLASLRNPIQLKDLAAASNLSAFHFHRSFTQVFRETPHQYLTRQRLELAAHLLRSTEMSVTDIGLEAGFESPASFSHLFRRRYGIPPLRYRRAT